MFITSNIVLCFKSIIYDTLLKNIWSQIVSERTLEPHTEYLFRFAIEVGINDTGDAISQFILCLGGDWENRVVYPLQQSRYSPILSKKGPNGLLRIFEVPFNTGESGTVSFLFAAQHAITRILTAGELQDYEQLEDLTYETWWQERREQMNAGSDTAMDNGGNIDLAGAHISERMLNKIIFSGIRNIDLAGAFIDPNWDHWDDETDGKSMVGQTGQKADVRKNEPDDAIEA